MFSRMAETKLNFMPLHRTFHKWRYGPLGRPMERTRQLFSSAESSIYDRGYIYIVLYSIIMPRLARSTLLIGMLAPVL